PTIAGACGMYRPPIGPVSAIEQAIVCMRMPGLADLRQPISRGFLHTATSGAAPAFFTRAHGLPPGGATPSASGTNGTSRIWSNSHFRWDPFAALSQRSTHFTVNDVSQSVGAGVDTSSSCSGAYSQSYISQRLRTVSQPGPHLMGSSCWTFR